MIKEQDRIERLEARQASLLERVSPADFENWLQMDATKASFVQFEIDSEDLREKWASGCFNEREELKAQGQALYLLLLEETIRRMKSDD